MLVAVFLQSFLSACMYQWENTRKIWKDVGGRAGRLVRLVYFFPLLLLHAYTEIRKSPTVVNWVKAYFSLLPPCDSAFFSMATVTLTVSGEEYGRGIQVNLSQRNCTFLRGSKISCPAVALSSEQILLMKAAESSPREPHMRYNTGLYWQ